MLGFETKYELDGFLKAHRILKAVQDAGAARLPRHTGPLWQTTGRRVPVMTQKQPQVDLPEDLLAAVDALVGPGGRSAFLAEAIREAVNRDRLLHILTDPTPILREGDYPEFHDGSELWVRRLRDEDDRLERERLGGQVSDSDK